MKTVDANERGAFVELATFVERENAHDPIVVSNQLSFPNKEDKSSFFLFLGRVCVWHG